VLGYSLVQSEEANKIIVEGVCDHGVTQLLGWVSWNNYSSF
jgi:hypothetical protein